MSSPNQLRYLDLRLEECARAPALHRHQRAALSALRERPDHPALFEAAAIAKALDRYAGRALLYDALGDDVRAAAMRRVLDAVVGRLDVRMDTLVPAILEAEVAAGEAYRGQCTLVGLVATVHRAVTTPDYRVAGRLFAERGWADVVAVDPGFDFPRLVAHRPYRERLPFDDRGVMRFAEWLDELTADPDPGFRLPVFTPPRIDPASLAASVSASVPSPGGLGEPAVDPWPPQIEALLEDRALTAARDNARRWVAPLAARTEWLVQPHIVALHAALERDLVAARTSAEVELALDWFRERLDIEANAGELLVAIAVRPIERMLDADGDGVAGRALAEAERLLGVPWRAAITGGWLGALLARASAIACDPDAEVPDGMRGEVGVGIAQTLRGAIDGQATEAARAFAAGRSRPAEALAALIAQVDASVPDRVAPEPVHVRFGGPPTPIGELAAVLERPREGLERVLAPHTAHP